MATEVTDHIYSGFRDSLFYRLFLADVLDYLLEFVRNNIVLEWRMAVGIFMKYDHLVSGPLVLCQPG